MTAISLGKRSTRGPLGIWGSHEHVELSRDVTRMGNFGLKEWKGDIVFLGYKGLQLFVMGRPFFLPSWIVNLVHGRCFLSLS